MSDRTVETTLTLSQHRMEVNASWNTASDINGNSTPNILSELSYNSVTASPLGLAGEITFNTRHSQFLLGFDAINGKFSNGKVIDSDYAGDNRTAEWSRSQSEIAGDKINTVNAYIGWAQRSKRHNLSLLAGYQSSEQRFRMKNGEQLLCNSPCSASLGEIAGLNSVYSMQWQGPWVGARWAETKGKHRVTVAYDYHFSNTYHGEAQWNLRSDLQQPLSFEHKADAQGHDIHLSYDIELTPQWNIVFFYQYTQWESKKGVETRYFSDNSIGKIQLNQAESESRAHGIGIQYHF